MKEKKLTIDDLLNALIDPNSVEEELLYKNKMSWERIGKKDFSDLNLHGAELNSFLEEWMASNPYTGLN